MCVLTHVRLFATPWTVAQKAPLSMGFSRQEHWRVGPFPSPGDVPNPGIEPKSPTRQTDSLLSESPGKAYNTRVGSLSLKKVPLRKFLKKGELLEQGAELGSPALQADSFPAELPGNHNNTF